MASRTVSLFWIVALFWCATLNGQENGSMNLEQSVCGLKEPFVFWLWSSMAGSPNADRLAGLHNVEDISFRTLDGRMLRGYRLKAIDRDGQLSSPKGYLLVMQGNAILADQIIGEFMSFAAAGLDVYVYDFRGYGRSAGRRRLKAIVSDYIELLATLNARDYARHYVYAMSFGGIVLLDGFDAHGHLDRIVIDSSPARLSDYGCPREYDPVNHLPADCSQCLFITGEKDRVVTRSMSQELVDTARQRGAAVLHDATFAHPFMDREPSVHRRRLQVIEDFLLGRGKP
jgi:alpha/beta superfamily hydrolase